VNQVMQLLQANSINRNQVNWVQLQEQVNARAAFAQTPADTYPALQYALDSLGDGYSLLIPADHVQRLLQGGLETGSQRPQGSSLQDGRVAYLQLPAILASPQVEEAYAIDLQRLIVEFDASNPCGWVVDLRQTNGGSMWALLAGLGPVIGEGLVGSFIYPDGTQRYLYYAMGRSLLDDEVQVGIENHISYQLPQNVPLAAILMGPDTINSGESLVVAFRGRGNARTFGQPTAGLLSGTQTFVLTDGSWILLATALVSDRQGNIYISPIQPDEYVSPDTSPTDLALQSAVDWLLRQPDCTTGLN